MTKEPKDSSFKLAFLLDPQQRKRENGKGNAGTSIIFLCNLPLLNRLYDSNLIASILKISVGYPEASDKYIRLSTKLGSHSTESFYLVDQGARFHGELHQEFSHGHTILAIYAHCVSQALMTSNIYFASVHMSEFLGENRNGML